MLGQLVNTIESDEFAAELGVVSSFRHFQSILADDERIKELVNDLSHNSELKTMIARRIYALIKTKHKPGYLRPDDIAIAAYLYALNIADHLTAYDVAVRVKETKDFW